MQLKPGSRWRSTVCETEVVVVRAPDRALELTCCDVPMVDRDDPTTGSTSSGAAGGEDVLIGKRYCDEDSGVEVLCTKGGGGPLVCDGRQMVIKAAKPLPSSD